MSFQRIQGLHNSHGGTPRPIESTGCGEFKVDGQIVELDGTATGVRVNNDAGRHSIGQTEIVGGGHTIDQQAQLITAGDGPHHGTVVRGGGSLRQLIEYRLIIEAPMLAIIYAYTVIASVTSYVR